MLLPGHGTMRKILYIHADRFSDRKKVQVFSLLAVLGESVHGVNRSQAYDLLLPKLQNIFTNLPIKTVGTEVRSKFDKKNSCNWLQNYYFLGVTELDLSFSARILEIRSNLRWLIL